MVAMFPLACHLKGPHKGFDVFWFKPRGKLQRGGKLNSGDMEQPFDPS